MIPTVVSMSILVAIVMLSASVPQHLPSVLLVWSAAGTGRALATVSAPLPKAQRAAEPPRGFALKGSAPLHQRGRSPSNQTAAGGLDPAFCFSLVGIAGVAAAWAAGRGSSPRSARVVALVSVSGVNLSFRTPEPIFRLFERLCQDSAVDHSACEEAAQEVANPTHWHLDPAAASWAVHSKGLAGRLLLTVGPIELLARAAGMPSPTDVNGDLPIGALALTHGPNALGQRVAFVHLVAAYPRGRGVGTVLLRHAEALATAAGCTAIVLRALDENLAQYYQRQGFTDIKDTSSRGAVFAAVDGFLTGLSRMLGSSFGLPKSESLAAEGCYLSKPLSPKFDDLLRK